ncbi:UNVERIFIED_CONTAM: hypothetical protein PYX00_007565 [Menopon gallinae]|uniref:Transmembrane protein INAFM2 n=1 Tax=Menopon gallinae TaxID=328185 RepID=A0AAW2HJI6_9NEOP
MSRNSVNCASSGGSVGAEVKFAGNDSKSKMYEPKHKKKLVRVLTVIAYIFSVSLAAITLSLFYLFIYNPGKPGHNAGSPNSTGRLYNRNNEGNSPQTPM